MYQCSPCTLFKASWTPDDEPEQEQNPTSGQGQPHHTQPRLRGLHCSLLGCCVSLNNILQCISRQGTICFFRKDDSLAEKVFYPAAKLSAAESILSHMLQV